MTGAAGPSVAVVGTGVIGASWVALFLSHGCDVTAYDPAVGWQARLEDFVARALPDLRALGATGEGRLGFADSAAATARGARFVQENGPEQLAAKRALLAELDAAAPASAVIASSTTAFPRSEIVADCATPERVIVGHPFNPPHLAPLVEIVGPAPDAEAVRRAVAFYDGLGRAPVVLKKEAVGHLANRLTAALWREALYIVEQGIAEPADVDRAVRHGPGLRWAALGPFEIYHLGGGPQGIRGYFEHLMPSQLRRWQDLGTPQLRADLVARVIAEVEAMTAGRSLAELAARRDERLRAILKALHETADEAQALDEGRETT